ncbi:MAG: aldehyde dehydrogenase [Flavisolibacter sp.]|nr:aldehyde dehydrogenase [Flavisolibacter sp.]
MNDKALLPLLEQMQQYFASGATQGYAFRRQQLEKLKEALYNHEHDLYEALYSDLKKNKEESWITEIGFAVTEINYALKKLRRWMKPQKVKTNLLNQPSKSYVLHEPLGVVLIIGPWNYPVQLSLVPLIGAIAAGNCVMLKPSEHAPATAALLQKMIDQFFDKQYITVVQGEGATVVPQMLEQFRFDHVFYTGNTQVGSIIYQMAAKKLIPVTLELGGKSPCIVESDANIKIAARRIAVTKFSNAGQMCVAPDYVLVHKSVEQSFLEALKSSIESFYNAEEVRGYHYGKIINEKQFNRLVRYLHEGTVVYGGTYDSKTLFIEPTLLTGIAEDSAVMQEEIFGPVLPLITWQDATEAQRIVQLRKDPLAFYVFTESKAKADWWIRHISFGGGCINNASWQLTNPYLPFGGRGNSGIGRYHGHYSFDTFSHHKAIMDTPAWFDPALKYPPFEGKLEWFKRIIK